MSKTSLARAKIINIDKTSADVDCLFNPKEYTFSKQNQWAPSKTSGADIPQMEFTSGKPATLQMQLFFDTYINGSDVRAHTDNLWEMMMVVDRLKDPKTQKSRPPKVRFMWGETWVFDAAITSIKQKFTLFLDNGIPVRAMVDVTFQQLVDTNRLRSQNPTSGGVGGERVWTVNPGDTLAWIAYQEYGDPNQWRRIAEANRLSDVRRLSPGTVLVIPNV